jgi:hypothetical protein
MRNGEECPATSSSQTGPCSLPVEESEVRPWRPSRYGTGERRCAAGRQGRRDWPEHEECRRRLGCTVYLGDDAQQPVLAIPRIHS